MAQPVCARNPDHPDHMRINRLGLRRAGVRRIRPCHGDRAGSVGCDPADARRRAERSRDIPRARRYRNRHRRPDPPENRGPAQPRGAVGAGTARRGDGARTRALPTSRSAARSRGAIRHGSVVAVADGSITAGSLDARPRVRTGRRGGESRSRRHRPCGGDHHSREAHHRPPTTSITCT